MRKKDNPGSVPAAAAADCAVVATGEVVADVDDHGEVNDDEHLYGTLRVGML